MATCKQCKECPPVQPLIPVCDDPTYCSEILYSRCLIYKGPDLPALGVIDGEDLNSVLAKVNAKIAQIENQ